jgi:hypothetical protein
MSPLLALFGRAAAVFDVRCWGLNRSRSAASEGRLLTRSRLGHAKSPENLHKIETGFWAMMSTLHFAVGLRCWQTVALPLYLYLRRLWGDDTQEVVVVANRRYGFHLAMLVLVVFHRDRPFRL